MERGLRRAAHRADALDLVGEDRPPVQRLLRPHRPPVDEGQLLDPEHVGEEPALGAHVVEVGEDRRAVRAEGRRDVARRGREAVGEHVGNDDEPVGRVEHPLRSDQPLDVGVLRGVGGRVEDDVRAVRREPPPGLVRELRARQGDAPLQGEVGKLENTVVLLAHGARSRFGSWLDGRAIFRRYRRPGQATARGAASGRGEHRLRAGKGLPGDRPVRRAGGRGGGGDGGHGNGTKLRPRNTDPTGLPTAAPSP